MNFSLVWTPDRKQQAKALFLDGFSASAIARELGDTTRNAVCGVLYRMGLFESARTTGKTTPVPRKRSVSVPRAPRRERRQVSAKRVVELSCERIEEPALNVDFRGIGLHELTDQTCRFPHGDGPFTFCGQMPIANSQYCEFHHRVAYRKVPILDEEERLRRADLSRRSFEQMHGRRW